MPPPRATCDVQVCLQLSITAFPAPESFPPFRLPVSLCDSLLAQLNATITASGVR